MKHTARTDTTGILAPSVGKFHFFQQEGMNAEAESKSGFPHFIRVWPTKWCDGGGSGGLMGEEGWGSDPLSRDPPL